MSKFSSFKESKMLFENWREHLGEAEMTQKAAQEIGDYARLSDEEKEQVKNAIAGGGEEQLNEDGHTDVASACRRLKTSIEDAQEMLNVLTQMDQEGDLPSWWMNKASIASDYLNKMRDYLLH
jgi:hypothetical protein